MCVIALAAGLPPLGSLLSRLVDRFLAPFAAPSGRWCAAITCCLLRCRCLAYRVIRRGNSTPKLALRREKLAGLLLLAAVVEESTEQRHGLNGNGLSCNAPRCGDELPQSTKPAERR